MSLLEKFRNYMLGVEEEETESDESSEKPYVEESRPSRERYKDLDYSSLKKRHTTDSNVLNLHTVEPVESKGKIIISRPLNVSDAPNVSDYLKQNMISVVNLEGIDRADAQRIADFLGGVSYALNCTIERISNDIFIIAPSQIGISNELKDEIKGSKGSVLPWMSAFR